MTCLITSGCKKKGFYLSLIATLLASIVVILGAYTRLVHAGLGCPDWPGCYGFLTVPQTPQDMAHARSLFPNSSVDVSKGWTEMIHRYAASVLMLLVLLIVIQAIKNRQSIVQPVKLPILIFVLITIQAVFGMWTVTLKLWPQVVTAHLIGGFATFSLLFLLTLRLSGIHQNRIRGKPFLLLKWIAILSLLVVITQITLGGWTSSNYAALACPDLPMCQKKWFPPMNFEDGFNIWQDVGPSYLGGQMKAEARTAIHFVHRLGALVTILLLTLQMLVSFKVAFSVGGTTASIVKKLAVFVMGLLTLQVFLGMSNIIWVLPLSVAMAHNMVGALLLLSLVAYNYFLFGGTRGLENDST